MALAGLLIAIARGPVLEISGRPAERFCFAVRDAAVFGIKLRAKIGDGVSKGGRMAAGGHHQSPPFQSTTFWSHGASSTGP
jgi:hypothetical protein